MVKYIEIGGEKRPVCYNNNALEEFEELTGLSVMEGMDFKKISHIKALAYCGLKHGFFEVGDYKPGLEAPFTLQHVGRWLDISTTPLIFEAFQRDTSANGEPSGEVDAEKKSVGVTSEV